MNPALRPLVLCLFLISSNAPGSEEKAAIGRLFFSPEQRSALDRQPTQGAGNAPQETWRLDGEIRRGKAQKIRWINGKAEDAGERHRPPLPVGDTYHHATGKRESLLGEGRLSIKRAGQK